MNAERDAERLERAPFVPFRLHLSDGRFLHVDRPDFATLLRDDQTLTVDSYPHRVVYLDFRGVISLETTRTGDNL